MPEYPDYVHKMLARARAEGQWQAAQADAAGICFDVLALFPDCEEAKELVYELFCNKWTIYDNRVAIQRNIDEWDDRPWQQRRGTRHPLVGTRGWREPSRCRGHDAVHVDRRRADRARWRARAAGAGKARSRHRTDRGLSAHASPLYRR